MYSFKNAFKGKYERTLLLLKDISDTDYPDRNQVEYEKGNYRIYR